MRHVREEAVADLLIRRAKCQRDVLLVEVADEPLHRAVIELDDVLEDEHEATNLFREARVTLGKGAKDLALRRPVDLVEDMGERLDPADLHRLDHRRGHPAPEAALDNSQDLGGRLLGERDPTRNLHLELRVELGEDASRRSRIEMREDDRDRLGMLLRKQVAKRNRVRALEEVEGIHLVRDGNPLEQVLRALLAVGLLEELERVGLAARHHARLRVEAEVRLLEHLVADGRVKLGRAKQLERDLVDRFRREPPQQLRRGVRAKGDEQCRSLARPREGECLLGHFFARFEWASSRIQPFMRPTIASGFSSATFRSRSWSFSWGLLWVIGSG